MTRRARIDLGVTAALLLVAAGVGGLGLGGWLLVTGPHTAARATTRGTTKTDDLSRKEPDPVDDGVVRALTAHVDARGGTQYLYVTHHHPGAPLDDVTLTAEVRGTGARKTTTRPQWAADQPLRVDMPGFFGKRAVVLTGEATQAGRPVRIDATVDVDAADGTSAAGKKKKKD